MTDKTTNEFKPAELVMLSTPIGLNSLGALFNIDAPFAACRLCGVVYQSGLDRLAYTYACEGLIEQVNVGGFIRYVGDEVAISVLDTASDKRKRWRRLHERRYHTTAEVNSFTKTGYAFTPEAANKLAPYGITPLGNMSEEIAAAMLEAPRAPLDDAEG